MNILDTLGITSKGQLPTVKVDVEIDNNSLLKIAGATFLVGLLLIVINKFSKK